MVLLILFSTTRCRAAEHRCEAKTLLTFNAALKPQVPQYESRKSRTASAVLEVNADVVCLQEIIYEEDVMDILDDVKQQYPFSWSFLHSSYISGAEVFNSRYFGPLFRALGEKPFPCSDPTFRHFQQCLTQNCDSFNGGLPLLLCLFHSCRDEGYALPTDCLACLASSAYPLATAISKCASGRSSRNRFQPEDVLVLSKRPILSARKIQIAQCIKQVYPRGLLEVDVRGIGKVVCTHLTSDTSLIPYIEVKLTEHLGITDYVEQQAREIEKINELYNGTNVILAGDLNTGPAVPSQDIPGEVVQNYNSLIAQGFQSPYVDLVGQCTYCPGNPVAIPHNSILDHVLFKGFRILEASRILDNASNPLSDHYGVKVTFCSLDD